MRGTMRIMGTPGDEPLAWDTEVRETVGTASAHFATLLLSGYTGFVTIPGPTRMIKEFEPEAEEIVMVMPLAGG